MKKVVKASYYDLFVMFQNDVPLGGREHYNGLGLERAVSLFTWESRCCFVDNGTFLRLKLFYCLSWWVKSAIWKQEIWAVIQTLTRNLSTPCPLFQQDGQKKPICIDWLTRYHANYKKSSVLLVACRTEKNLHIPHRCLIYLVFQTKWYIIVL